VQVKYPYDQLEKLIKSDVDKKKGQVKTEEET